MHSHVDGGGSDGEEALPRNYNRIYALRKALGFEFCGAIRYTVLEASIPVLDASKLNAGYSSEGGGFVL